jgi:predicted membrane protein
MNEKGNFIIIAIVLMVGLIFLLPVLMYVFPPIDIIIKIILIFVIFSTVRGYLGNGALTLIISGILIYLLVIKWWWIGATGWFAITLASFGLLSIITWGSKTVIDLTKPKR